MITGKTQYIVVMLLLALLVQMLPLGMSTGCGMAAADDALSQVANGDHAHHHAMAASDSVNEGAATEATAPHADCCGSEDATGHCMMTSCLPISIPPSLAISAAEVFTPRIPTDGAAPPLVSISPLFRPPIA